MNTSTEIATDPTDRRVNIRDDSLLVLSCGLCVLPPRQNGSKAPDAKEWTEYQDRRSTLDEIHAWYGTRGEPKRTGLGVVCGAVSGNLEVLEFDANGEAYEPFKAAATALGMGELIKRIEVGCLERSPSGGIHWPYYCETISGNTKLAEYLTGNLNSQGKPEKKALIETRGQGGYIVTAPSHGKVHPSGRSYELLSGGFLTIATISPGEREQLWNLARSLCRLPEKEDDTEVKARQARSEFFDDTVTPWDQGQRTLT